jgi:DNA modification methylase
MNADNNANIAMVSDLESSKATLKRVNWDFHETSSVVADENSPFKCSDHFWGPAAFVPQIPFTLIEVLSLPGATVYDPFAGVGTTYFQALLLNRRPMATDICSVNVQYMRSLLTLFNPDVQLPSLQKSIDSMILAYDANETYVNDVPANIMLSQLRPWYSSETLNQLAFLFKCESACVEVAASAAMWIAISHILRTVSSQERGWGCVADNVLPKPNQVKDKKAIASFSTHLHRLLRDISRHLSCALPGYNDIYESTAANPMIFHDDVRRSTQISDNSVDLVITSPPYPNMTDYANSRRLSYYYAGGDPSKDSKLEIGARIRRRTKGALESYLADMEAADSGISRKLKKGGYACYVMPVFGSDNENNASRRRIVQRVMTKLEDSDLIREGEFERIIPKRRRQHNAKWAKLDREKIYLFRKV